MSVFQGVAPWHTIFTSSCVIPLWDSAKAQSLPYKEFNPSLKEDARFFRALHLAIQFSRHPVTSLFETQQQLKYPQVKSSSFPLWKNHVTQDLLFCNVLTLSYLGSLWFGSRGYYSLNPYVHLYYLWSISIAKDCYYPKEKILFNVWYTSIAKDCRFAEECSPRLWWSVFEITNVSRFIANLQIRWIISNLKKNMFYISGRNLRVSSFKKMAQCFVYS